MDATVIQWTETTNELGINEMASTWSTVANIKGILQQLSKGERFIDGTDHIVGSHRFFTAVNTSILNENRLMIGTKEYEIKSIENPMELNHHYEMVLQLVQ